MGTGCSCNVSTDQLPPCIAEIQTVWTLDPLYLHGMVYLLKRNSIYSW